MAQALSDFDNGAHSQEFYEALAWIGLMDTIAWNNLSQEERTDITATIINAIENEPFD